MPVQVHSTEENRELTAYIYSLYLHTYMWEWAQDHLVFIIHNTIIGQKYLDIFNSPYFGFLNKW